MSAVRVRPYRFLYLPAVPYHKNTFIYFNYIKTKGDLIS